MKNLSDSSAITNQAKKPITISPFINRCLYILFILIGLYLWFWSDDKIMAVSQFGIALIFDPFNQLVPFPKRPWYQKTWLIVHTLAVLICIIWILFT